MKTYAAIKSEIAKLEKQAEAARKAEIAGVVGRIREAIAAYGLTAQDLGFGPGGRGDSRRAKPAARTTVGVPKYRDPATGRTWTGRGKPPAWIAGVKDREALLIEPASAGAATGRRAAAKGGRKGRGASKDAEGAKRALRKGPSRKGATAPEKTAAVVIESGAASE